LTLVLFFILGILFVQAIIPFIDILISWFGSWVEARKAVHAIKINECNIRIKNMADDEKPKRVLGFISPEEETVKDDEKE
jgi:hypothetical protein